MTSLSNRNQLMLGLFLAFAMALTRSHHFAAMDHLPDASWAVYFLAGAFLRSRWAFVALSGLAVASDWVAISVFGVSSFCVTPAYAALLAAYGALWTAGRWYAGRMRLDMKSLLPLGSVLLASGFAAELISSGSFYFFGGRFAEPTLAGFMPRIAEYFPADLGALFMYAGLFALFYALVATRKQAIDADGPRTLQPGMKP